MGQQWSQGSSGGRASGPDLLTPPRLDVCAGSGRLSAIPIELESGPMHDHVAQG